MTNNNTFMAWALALAMVILPATASAAGWEVFSKTDAMDGTVVHGGFSPEGRPLEQPSSPYRDLSGSIGFTCVEGDEIALTLVFSKAVILGDRSVIGDPLNDPTYTLRARVGAKLYEGHMGMGLMFSQRSGKRLVASNHLVDMDLWSRVFGGAKELLLEIPLYEEDVVMVYDVEGAQAALEGSACPPLGEGAWFWGSTKR